MLCFAIAQKTNGFYRPSVLFACILILVYESTNCLLPIVQTPVRSLAEGAFHTGQGLPCHQSSVGDCEAGIEQNNPFADMRSAGASQDSLTACAMRLRPSQGPILTTGANFLDPFEAYPQQQGRIPIIEDPTPR